VSAAVKLIPTPQQLQIVDFYSVVHDGASWCKRGEVTSSARAEQEYKPVRAGLREAVDGSLARIARHSTINAFKQVISKTQVIFLWLNSFLACFSLLFLLFSLFLFSFSFFSSSSPLSFFRLFL